MRVLQDVFAGYRASLQLLAPFTLIHLSVRLLAAAVIVPVSGVVLAAALAASGQHAVTDQDIAWFLLTYVWTVNDPVTMVRLISMGVDGLITDEPALARQVMEARNQLSAPERLLLWVSDRFRLKSFDLVAEEAGEHEGDRQAAGGEERTSTRRGLDAAQVGQAAFSFPGPLC